MKNRAAMALVLASLVALAACTPWRRPEGTMGPSTLEVRYFGHSMVLTADRVHTVVVDPFQPHTGFPVPKTSANLVLVSRDRLDHNNVASVGGSPKVFSEPGVFILGDLRITGVPSRGLPDEKGPPNVMYRWQLGGVSLVHLGDLATADLTDDHIALLGNADILFCPVGGGVTLDASEAAAAVRRLTPRVVVPVRYKTGPSTLDIDGLQGFVDRMDRVRAVPAAIRITRERLPEPTEVWVLDWR